MITTFVGNKTIDLTKEEANALDEIIKGRRKYGLDHDKVLDWSIFRYTEHQREVFDRVWDFTKNFKVL